MRDRIVYLQYTNPAAYPPLQHSSRILADAGWEVLFLGTGARGADTLTFPPHGRIREKRLRFQPPGWRQKLHYLGYCGWVLAHVVWWRAGWVYASDLWSCPPALLASWWPGCEVLYHEHDSPAGGGGLFQRFCLWARRRLVQRAAVCVLPSEGRAKVFAAANSPKRVEVVWNCPAREEVGPRKSCGTSERLLLVYHGSIGRERLPLAVVKAMAQVGERMGLRIMGYETASSTGYLREIYATARALGIEARVEVLGTIPERSHLLVRCYEADIGLTLMPLRSGDLNMNHMAGASNKPFDYLSGGLALLVSDLPEWREMFVQPGYGLACNPDDPESIAAALRWFLEHPAEMRAMGEAGRQRILAEWNYEARFTAIRRLLQKQPQSALKA
jgi:glycosyltransferase involved in cell wall biosynthesis